MPELRLFLVSSLVSVTCLCGFIKFGGSPVTELDSQLYLPVHSLLFVTGVQEKRYLTDDVDHFVKSSYIQFLVR